MGNRGPRSCTSSVLSLIEMGTPDLGRNEPEIVDHKGGNIRPFSTSPGSSNSHLRMRRQLRPGSPRCECGACGEGFNSVRAFDRHQRMTPNGGVRCLDSPEMMAKGMVCRDGWWYTTAEVWRGPTDAFAPRD